MGVVVWCDSESFQTRSRLKFSSRLTGEQMKRTVTLITRMSFSDWTLLKHSGSFQCTTSTDWNKVHDAQFLQNFKDRLWHFCRGCIQEQDKHNAEHLSFRLTDAFTSQFLTETFLAAESVLSPRHTLDHRGNTWSAARDYSVCLKLWSSSCSSADVTIVQTVIIIIIIIVWLFL